MAAWCWLCRVQGFVVFNEGGLRHLRIRIRMSVYVFENQCRPVLYFPKTIKHGHCWPGCWSWWQVPNWKVVYETLSYSYIARTTAKSNANIVPVWAIWYIVFCFSLMTVLFIDCRSVGCQMWTIKCTGVHVALRLANNIFTQRFSALQQPYEMTHVFYC